MNWVRVGVTEKGLVIICPSESSRESVKVSHEKVKQKDNKNIKQKIIVIDISSIRKYNNKNRVMPNKLILYL